MSIPKLLFALPSFHRYCDLIFGPFRPYAFPLRFWSFTHMDRHFTHYIAHLGRLDYSALLILHQNMFWLCISGKRALDCHHGFHLLKWVSSLPFDLLANGGFLFIVPYPSIPHTLTTFIRQLRSVFPKHTNNTFTGNRHGQKDTQHDVFLFLLLSSYFTYLGFGMGSGMRRRLLCRGLVVMGYGARACFSHLEGP